MRQDKRVNKSSWDKFEDLKINAAETHTKLSSLTEHELIKQKDFALWYIELARKQGQYGWVAYYELLWEIIAAVSTDNLFCESAKPSNRKRTAKTPNRFYRQRNR